MSKIVDVKNTTVNFLKEELNCYDPKVIKAEKINENKWETMAEVYEEDSFLKSMNLPPKKERLFYAVSLDDNLEITAYKRMESYGEEEDENE